MIVSADKIAGVFTTLLDSIDYSNFKSQIGRTEDQIEKLHAYHEIWEILEAMQSWAHPACAGPRSLVAGPRLGTPASFDRLRGQY